MKIFLPRTTQTTRTKPNLSFGIIALLVIGVITVSCENPFFPDARNKNLVIDDWKTPDNEKEPDDGVITYSIVINFHDNEEDDTLIAEPQSGIEGTEITLSYILTDKKKYNLIDFGGIFTEIESVTSAGSGTRKYIIDPEDAINEVITIIATFTHTDLIIDHINFTNETPIIQVTYGDAPFTNAIKAGHLGTGAITYSSEDETVATVNNSGVVTIHKIGSTVITAGKEEDAIYAHSSASYSLDIEPKALIITDIIAVNRDYDGAATATLTGGTLVGVVDGDDVSIILGSGTMTNANAGDNKPVTTAIILNGEDINNYTLTQPTDLTVTINRKDISITGFNIIKEYDGTDTVTSFGTLSFVGFVNLETAAVSTVGVNAIYPQVIIGTDLVINFNGNFTMTTGTANASNYNIIPPSGITGNIIKATPAAPNPPKLALKDETSVNITVPDGVNTAFALEYAYNSSYTEPVSGWQDGLSFIVENITTACYIFARYKAGDNNNVSASRSLMVVYGEFFQFEVTVTDGGRTFAIPLSGRLGGNSNNKTYNWDIDWGDGSIIQNVTQAGVVTGDDSNGIPHFYTSAGTYTITIIPAGSKDSWLSAFGFYINTSGANANENKNMVTKIISPLTPLMTRTQTQLNSGTAPNYEWSFTFSQCTNLTMGEHFNFSEGWNNITTVGNYFTYYMFYYCSGSAFNMNDLFNLPKNIITVGDYFVSNMFSGSGSTFTMNKVFNLPQEITNAGTYFAGFMFSSCSGSAFKMNEIFNLPQKITTVGDNFIYRMFYYCYGAAFKMSEVFNLPQEITTVGNYFANGVFGYCYGTAFTMNEVFNLPQKLTSVGNDFVRSMFMECRGASFTMNTIFNLPQGIVTTGTDFCGLMFANCFGPNFTMNDIFNFPQGITIARGSFAGSMFFGCSGASFNMNEIFNFPQDIITIDGNFAQEMFNYCYGAAFNMNEVFNLPQKVTVVGYQFVYLMFTNCYGTSFTMNKVFNLPQETTVNSNFAYSMFQNCGGAAFMINAIFKFPVLSQSELDMYNTFANTFNLRTNAPLQTRTAESIINGNPVPSDDKNTFQNSTCFSDYHDLHANWK